MLGGTKPRNTLSRTNCRNPDWELLRESAFSAFKSWKQLTISSSSLQMWAGQQAEIFLDLVMTKSCAFASLDSLFFLKPASLSGFSEPRFRQRKCRREDLKLQIASSMHFEPQISCGCCQAADPVDMNSKLVPWKQPRVVCPVDLLAVPSGQPGQLALRLLSVAALIALLTFFAFRKVHFFQQLRQILKGVIKFARWSVGFSRTTGGQSCF